MTPHHQFDSTIGVAQAEDVKCFWETTLEKQVHQAFQVYAQFEAFSGDPRIFAWDDTVVAFPTSHRDDIKKLTLKNTGVAAAAKTGEEQEMARLRSKNGKRRSR